MRPKSFVPKSSMAERRAVLEEPTGRSEVAGDADDDGQRRPRRNHHDQAHCQSVETVRPPTSKWPNSCSRTNWATTVEVTDLDENAQWSAINTGELHASLEVWPSGHAQNRTDFIDNPDGNVADAGLLGPIGKIGWWMPAYMVEQHPALATADGFTDPELAGLFATAETGDLGQILHGDPSWVTFEQDIIDDLGLHLEIVYAGSEEALLAAFDGAFARDEPVLSYFWTPHSAFNTFDLVELELPPEYYPADNLFKIVWAGLEEGAPSAWTLLHNFNYTTADQVSILAAIEGEGKSRRRGCR